MYKFKKLKLVYLILNLISKNYSVKEIKHKLNIKKQLLNYYIKKLKQYNLIKLKLKTTITYYELTPQGANYLLYLKQYFSKLKQKYISKFNYHNLQIKYNILSIDLNLYNNLQFDKIVKLKNTIQKIKTVNEFPFQFTLKILNDKTVIVYLHQKTFNDLNEFYDFMFRFSLFLYNYLQKHGIKIDAIGKVINQHISISLPKTYKDLLENMLKDKNVIQIDLDRQAKAPLSLNYNKKGKVWIDRSLGELELETNDLKYVENFLLMPERVEKMFNLILIYNYEFSKNLREHTKAIKKLNKLLEKLDKKY